MSYDAGRNENGHVQHDLVGESGPMIELVHWIGKVARSAAAVLIQGESGTGKELVARALHRNSPRSMGPFVAVNCAALPDHLLESELFGYEKGAFTDAVKQRIGRFEMADGGTLFLDEIGEMKPAVQAKLLRVLEDWIIYRIGGNQPVPIDIRLITATNRDLNCAIAEGSFRPDLYYRLNVLRIQTPPLRSRREDIPVLARYFVLKYRKGGRTVRGISPEAESILCAYDWPGNVRQLQNVIEQAIVLGSTELIEPADLPPLLPGTSEWQMGAVLPTLEEALAEAERQFVEYVFKLAGGDYNKAAELLRRHPKGMHRLISRLNLSHLKKHKA